MEVIEENSDFEVQTDYSEEEESIEELSDDYKVEYWEEGETEPTGYKIKGKFIFGKAVEMLKLRLKKSKIAKKIEDKKYFVTDVRNIKHGTEVDIELERDEKGGACIKIFGPNKKNEYTLVVNKTKKFPQKFVKFVATEVIIPLVDSFISSIQNEVPKKSTNSSMEFCCVDCGKRFISERNLKIHVGKMHEKDDQKPIPKSKQMSVLKGKNTSRVTNNKKQKSSSNLEAERDQQEVPMELDIVVSGSNPNVHRQEGENLQIDISRMFKEISDLKKSNEQNHLVIKNLVDKVESLEKQINKLQNKDQESSQNCEQCSFQTNENWRLLNHIQIAHENGCDKCDEHFESRKDLARHKKSIHRQLNTHCEDYLMDTCLFSKEECLYLHAEKEKSEVDLKCTECGNMFRIKEELKEHMLLHLQSHDEDKDIMQVDQFECIKCHNMFSNFEVLNEHLKLHEQPQQNICSECDETFTSKELLIGHKKKTHEFKCSKCNDTFSNEINLKTHYKSHLKFIPCKNALNCQYRENCFYSHEPRKDNEYPCYECGNKFESVRTLMGHRKTQHKSQVCKKFLENKCIFNEDGCWFSHTIKDQKHQGFQKEPPQLKPPIQQSMGQNQLFMKTVLDTMEQIKAFMVKAQ